ncbi:MAG: LysM domain-containing protein [Gaiellaceae bacterium]
MFEPTSRYSGLETTELTVLDPAGEPRVLAYVRRRFVQGAPSTATLVSHTVVQGDRLDHLAARYLGDPTQFWRICDANGVLRPEELVEEPGRRVDIPLPGGL